jgi:hypothetical protein
MSALMDLIAGDAREIVLAVAIEDWPALDDRSRFDAHLALGRGLDPTWLDLFSEAARSVTEGAEPADFIDARRELDQPGEESARTLERVDHAWIEAVAALTDRQVDAVAGRWVELVEEDLGDLPREEKPWIRELAGEIVAFARAAADSRDIVFAWDLGPMAHNSSLRSS